MSDATHVIFIFFNKALPDAVYARVSSFMTERTGHNVVISEDEEALNIVFFKDEKHLAATIHPTAYTFFFKTRYSDEASKFCVGRILRRLLAALRGDCHGLSITSMTNRIIANGNVSGH
jgi:hypothetical protein